MARIIYWTEKYVPDERMGEVIGAIDKALRVPVIYRLLTPEESKVSDAYFAAKNRDDVVAGSRWKGAWLIFNGYTAAQGISAGDDERELRGSMVCLGMKKSPEDFLKESFCMTQALPYMAAVVLAMKIALDAGIITDLYADDVREFDETVFREAPDKLFPRILEQITPYALLDEEAQRHGEHAMCPSKTEMLRAYGIAASRLGLPHTHLTPLGRAARAVAAHFQT